MGQGEGMTPGQTEPVAGTLVAEKPRGDRGLPRPELQCEERGGDSYEYYPLGEYVVAAPGVCRGRPTFKYTRIDVAFILERLAGGETVDDLVAAYGGKLSGEALEEAQRLSEIYPSQFFTHPYPPSDSTPCSCSTSSCTMSGSSGYERLSGSVHRSP